MTATGEFIVGVNYPWVHCGHDFGPEPPGWGSGRRNFSKVEHEFRTLAELGIKVARFWILGGGVNYPVGEAAHCYGDIVPLPRGLFRLRKLFTLRVHPDQPPPPLPAAFLDDFAQLLKACRNARVRLLPSLLSFEWFQPLLDHQNIVTNCGRGDFVLRMNGGVAAFLDATLTPLLEIADDYRDAIYAFEVMNEPDWVVRGGRRQFKLRDYGLWPSPRTVSREGMCSFLGAGVDRITGAGFLSTIGFGDPEPSWWTSELKEKLDGYAAEGSYVHQAHFYPTVIGDRRIPFAENLPINPCLVGEFPTAMANGPSNRSFSEPALRQTEHDPDRYLEARLSLIRERGYAGALPWAVRSTDNRTTWGNAQRSQIARFSL